MPSAAAITLYDAQATPVAHNFIPLGTDPKDFSIFWFEDQSAVSSIGYWKLSVQVKRPLPGKTGESSEKRTNRVLVGLHEPVLETVSNSTVTGITPSPTVSFISRAFVEFVMPERATAQNRQDLRKMLAEAINNSNIVAAIENLQSFY